MRSWILLLLCVGVQGELILMNLNLLGGGYAKARDTSPTVLIFVLRARLHGCIVQSYLLPAR